MLMEKYGRQEKLQKNLKLTLCHTTSEVFGLGYPQGKTIACSVREPVQAQHDDIDEGGCLKLHLDCKDWRSMSV